MDKEKYREIYQKFRNADKKYRDYVEQFFTKIWEGETVQEATKILNRESFKKIKELQKEVDTARQELDKFFGIKQA